LFPHATGRWAKKVRGKFCYFGKIADDPKGDAALILWLEQKDDLLAGRAPRVSKDGLTVKALANRFLTMQEQRRDSGEIRPRTFGELLGTCEMVVATFGSERLVDDLSADDFENLRVILAKRYGVHRLTNEIQRTRSLFKYALDAGLIDRQIRTGTGFKRPAKRLLRAARHAKGARMFEATQIRALIDTADQPLKAMILLGINCGFGNADVGTLPLSAVNLRQAWIDFPRPKTEIQRRCPLWAETIVAIKGAIKDRPNAKSDSHAGLLFVTKYGGPWAKETPDSPVAKEFRKLLDALGFHRPGLGFYALRHTFETIGGESRDQIAVDYIMGHADESMAAHYRERISDERLLAVVNYVHDWLFPRPEASQ